MNVSRNVAALACLVALSIAGSIVLLALHDQVPDFMSFVVTAGIGALAGVAVPSSIAGERVPSLLPAVATPPAAPRPQPPLTPAEQAAPPAPQADVQEHP